MQWSSLQGILTKILLLLFFLSQFRNNNYLMNYFGGEEQQVRNDHKNQIKNKQVGSNLVGNSKQELKEIYMCECGKQYQSFPATYLHFRSKHDIKLSTKSNERRKVVEIEGDIKKITYVLEVKNQQKFSTPQNQQDLDDQAKTTRNQDLCPQFQLVQSCINRYLNVSNIQNSGLYDKLIKFIDLGLKQKQGKQNDLNVERIPYFLNDFALYFLPKNYDYIKVGSQYWKQCCSELKSFCDWLRNENYTELLVIYDKV